MALAYSFLCAEGSPEVPAESDAGSPEMPAEWTPEIQAEETPAMPDEGSPEVPAESDAGSPEVPAEGSPEVPAEWTPVMPAEGSPEMPAEGSPEVPAEGTSEMPAEQPLPPLHYIALARTTKDILLALRVSCWILLVSNVVENCLPLLFLHLK